MKKIYLGVIIFTLFAVAACSSKTKEDTTTLSKVSTENISSSEAKTSETTKISENSSKSLKMNLEEIKVGNYSSVNGTWKNSKDQIITINNNTIEISNIYTPTDELLPATVSKLSINIPSKNDEDGNPVKVHAAQGKVDSYGKELTSSFDNGYVVLKANIPYAMILISFLPINVLDDLKNSNEHQERITAVITQNSATAIPEEQFYYRVDNDKNEEITNTNKTQSIKTTVVTKENVLSYAENYLNKYAPNWEGSFLFEEQLEDGSFKLFYDSQGAARGVFIIDDDGTVTRLDSLGNPLKSLEG